MNDNNHNMCFVKTDDEGFKSPYDGKAPDSNTPANDTDPDGIILELKRVDCNNELLDAALWMSLTLLLMSPVNCPWVKGEFSLLQLHSHHHQALHILLVNTGD